MTGNHHLQQITGTIAGQSVILQCRLLPKTNTEEQVLLRRAGYGRCFLARLFWSLVLPL